MDGRYITEMKKQARRFGVNLIPGSFAETCGEKVKNTCALIDRSGEVAGSYSKVHLMDAIGIRESDAAVPGDKLGVFDTDFGRIGLMVCFDLRFPEQPRSMVLQGADIIFCAASFPTGSPLPPRTDHWDLLVQSTALLNLTWTCAVNQFGSICGGTENPFGRSMVVDPWGIVTASALGRRDIVYATLDMQHQKEIRGLIIGENNIVSLLGVLCGILPGIGLTGLVLRVCESEMMAYPSRPAALSVVLASVVTYVFSLLIQLLLTRKVRGIDMVEALKSVE